MKHSLKYKAMLVLVAFALLLTGTSAFLSRSTIENMSEQQYRSRANELAASIACVIDADLVKEVRDNVMAIYHATENKVGSEDWGSDAFNEYTARFAQVEETEAFQELLTFLRDLQEVNSVDCLYISTVERTDVTFVYLLDAALEDACPPGCIDPLYEMNMGLIEDPSIGLPAYITNTEEYGWLVSAGAPILDETGEVLGYAMVDISMNAIKAEENAFVLNLIGALALATALLCAVVILFVNRYLVRPLNRLSQSAASYADSGSLHKTSFDTLDIHTGDEIESLHKSMIQMEKDIENYIDNLMQTRAILDSTRLEAQKMNELAHKDALTGIRNRMAYDQEVYKLDGELRDGLLVFGIAMIDMDGLKGINDAYGHDCGNVSLTRLSRMICEVFRHSPVFRIGGDEFAVILQNSDYDRIEELVKAFEDRLAAQDRNAEPWEIVSATLGYALYDPSQDGDVEDVFRRADQRMYELKKQRKANR